MTTKQQTRKGNTMTRKLTEAMIYWDNNDPECWAARVTYEDGSTRSGSWGLPVDDRNGGIEDAVVYLAGYNGTTITADQVAVDQLCGTWTLDEEATV
jgi:hypothetical protein